MTERMSDEHAWMDSGCDKETYEYVMELRAERDRLREELRKAKEIVLSELPYACSECGAVRLRTIKDNPADAGGGEHD